MTVNGQGIAAAAGTVDRNALRKQKEQQVQMVRKKEEGKKQAAHILTSAMEQGTSMEEARETVNDLLAALSAEIVADCMNRVREHVSDILEQNQKKADELAEKKRKKEERKQKKEEQEAIREGKLVLKRVLVPVPQAGTALADAVPVCETRAGDTAKTAELPEEAYLVGVQKYVMATEVTAPEKIRSILNVKA